MTCYHPLKGFKIGITDKGKDKLLVTSYDVDHLEFSPVTNRFEKRYTNEVIFGSGVLQPLYDIPCGRCIGCRLDKSRDWANRCLLEMQRYQSNYFITLTYDDDHLPCSVGVDPSTGEYFISHSLVKRHWQLFMKRLRKWYEGFRPGEKLRFFMAGEYGDRSGRPHYHAIIFNLEIPDLIFYKRAGDFNYYISDVISQLWSDESEYTKVKGKKRYIPRGFVVIAPASWETAAYTARYVTKKLSGDMAELYQTMGIIPEFCLMSRRPGIGFDYVENNLIHLLDFDKISVATPDGGRSFPPPKYFKRKYDEFFETDFEEYDKKCDRQALAFSLMESVKADQLSKTDLSYLDMLAVAEHAKLDQLKGLERSL